MLRFSYSSFTLLGAFVLVLFALGSTCCVSRFVSVEQVDKLIRDQLPTGSNRQQVKNFIENLKFGSLKIGRDRFYEATPQTLVNRDPEKVAELGTRIKEFTGVVVFDAESGFLYHNNLVMQFYLDENSQLIGYTVKMDGAE